MKSTPIYYTLDAMFGYTCAADDDPVAFLDEVVISLESLDAEDVIVALDPVDRKFSVSLLIASIDGETVETVVGKGMGLLRTSIHAGNGGAANWPSLREAFLGVDLRRAGVAPSVDSAVSAGVQVRV